MQSWEPLRLRQIKGLAKVMEMFGGRARKRVQVSQFLATALVVHPWQCFPRPNVWFSNTFPTAPCWPVGAPGNGDPLLI